MFLSKQVPGHVSQDALLSEDAALVPKPVHDS